MCHVYDSVILPVHRVSANPNFFLVQAESLTESDSWMCPECQDKEALKDKSKGKRVTTPASSYKPIPITPMTITAATTKEDLGAKKAAKIVNSKKKEEGREEKKSLAPVPPKKNLVLAEKLKKAATATERKSGDR